VVVILSALKFSVLRDLKGSTKRPASSNGSQTFDGYGHAGSVGTAGGVVFVGTGSNVAGYLFADDATTGERLWKFNTGAGVYFSPSVYMVNGEEFVTVASGGGDLIVTFALPKQRS
jgi:glucose dehydrogenase